MTMRNVMPHTRALCNHLAKFGMCLDPGCTHFDRRIKDDPTAALFGSTPNSAYAVSLHKSDLAEYERQRKLGVGRGLIAPRLSDRAAALKRDVTEFQ